MEQFEQPNARESADQRRLSQPLLIEDGDPPPETRADSEAWEISLGMKWFSRIGIVALLIGLAMALNYSFDYLNSILTAPVKIIIGWLLSFGLYFGGHKLFRDFRLLGRILQGGGMALGYLTLYGTFFIPAVQLFPEPGLQSLGWGLLFLYAGGMIAMACRMDSLSAAMLSLAFGYYTASYSGSQLVALLSTSILGLASLFLAHRKPEWKLVSKVAFLGFVGTYLFWHWPRFSSEDYMPGFLQSLLGDRADETAYLLINALIFQVASLLPAVNGNTASHRTRFAIGNSFVTYLLLLWTQGDLLTIKGLAESGFAATHLISFLLLSRDGRNPIATQANLLMSVLFSVLAVFGLMDGEMQTIALAAGSLVLGLLSRDAAYRTAFQFSSLMVLGLALVSLLLFNWTLCAPAILLATVGAVSTSILILEGSAFRNIEEAFRIAMLLVSGFLFLAALLVGLQSYWITLAIVTTGSAFLSAGFVSGERKYRWMGLCWIFLGLFRLISIDLLTLATVYKIMLFLGTGVFLLAGSYGYNLLNRRLGNAPSGRQIASPETIPETDQS